MSYRRTVFEELGGFDGRYFPQEDYLFHWLLAKAGIKIYFEPEIQVRHIHRQHLGAYLRHCYRFGIVTARVLKITDYPGCFFVQRPYIAPLFIPALPFIKFARTCWRVLRASPQLLFRHALVLPLLMIGLFMWQAGFAVATYSPNPSLTATRVAIF
jgi:GT2 family glycosyltransferase